MLTNAVAPDKLGGLERYVRELSAELVCRDVGVEVLAKQVAPNAAREMGADGVGIRRYRVGSRSSVLFAPTYPFRTATAVRCAVRERRGAVLHAHFPVPALPLALARERYVYTFHAPVHRELLSERHDAYPLARPFGAAAVEGLRRAERLVVRRAAAIVVLSEFSRSELRKLDPVAAERARLVPGGVDPDRFTPGATAAAGVGPRLFTARRLTPRTGVSELLRALPAILAAHPSAKLEIAGTGRSEQALRDEARGLRLDGAVTFAGRIGEEELVDAYRSADLVVMPTQALEGFGLATAEALSCGTPVVGTPVGATPELLAPIDPVLLARDGSPEGLASAVLALLADGVRLAAIRSALPAAVSKLAWPRVVDAYLDEYERLSEVHG